MEIYAFFIWPAIVFSALATYGWYAIRTTGKHSPHPARRLDND